MGTQLIFTVGIWTNPLPVWVAWYHLKDKLQPPVTVRLVHTARTSDERKRLQRLCGGVLDNQTYQTSAGNPGTVHTDISTKLVPDIVASNSTLFHVHYTGGTKVMSVETVAAIEECLPEDIDMQTSYLDPRASGGPTILDWAGIALSEDARRGVAADLSRIADLNGFELGPFPHTYWKREVGNEVTDDFPGPSELTEKQINDGNNALCGFISPEDFHLLEYGAYAALKAALERICRADSSRCNYKLFHNVYVRRPVTTNLRVRPFELDVVAVLGYQIVVVSCTVSGEADKVKEKGMEAILRARQLGGDEARAIVLCSVGEKLRPYIEAELQDETGSSDLPLQIWGKDKWCRLSTEFYQYLHSTLHWR